ncbi:MAG TPA: PEP/pyruvate-binding domain-containing protein [Solirubrobacteraceae bacterium]|jgi:pyruvate,water dikinase|nr:PEP/pyruvate-binding domain-containing protein [Solirubrobacteraceae bacterium]
MAEAAPQHTRGLEELRAGDADGFGGKSASLGELLQAGIPVPPGFAIGTSAGERLTDALRDEIAVRYGRLGDSVPVAVRSSAIGEDSAEATFAGQQDTYLWVRGAGAVCDAVQNCWASLYSAEAVSYREHLGDRAPAQPAMGVTVQLMVDAAVSGVMFTCNPVSGDPSMIAINASWGLGLAVVGGEVTPDDYLVSKITGEIVRQTVADKSLEYVAAPDGHGTSRVDVDDERRGAACLDVAAIGALLDLAKRIQRHFGAHQDVEWAFDRSGELFVVQSRPVTGLPERPATPKPASALSLVMSKFGAGR